MLSPCAIRRAVVKLVSLRCLIRTIVLRCLLAWRDRPRALQVGTFGRLNHPTFIVRHRKVFRRLGAADPVAASAKKENK